MMLAQTTIVASILMGRAVGWTPQTRDGAGVPWVGAFRFHAAHMLVGATLSVVALFHSPALAAWMSPTLLALCLAAPISVAGGSPRLGEWLRRRGLMATPQELKRPAVVVEAAQLQHSFPDAPGNALLTLAGDPELFNAHRNAIEPTQRGRGAVDAVTALATVKLAEAQSLEEAAEWLAPAERLTVLGDGPMLDRVRALSGARAPRD